ncbi:MAG: ribonuclease III [Nitrospinota bacterium]
MELETDRHNDLIKFSTLLGFEFNNLALLDTALTHKSFQDEKRGLFGGNNERLEFLGDTVLDIIISEHIFRENQNWTEGELTKKRAQIVSKESLAEVARGLSIGSFIKFGNTELASNGANKSSILADSLEALVAAIYLDAGYSLTQKFVLETFSTRISKVTLGLVEENFKSQLQDILKGKASQLSYKLVKEEGKTPNKIFFTEAWFGEKVYGRGVGSSIKASEQEAAKEVLTKVKEIEG